MLNEIDLSRADLNLLVLFEAVIEARHVGRAAQRLHLSASAVSHGLGRLRAMLGDPLFLRTPKGVVPTERAVELERPIADILASVRSVIEIAEPFNPARSRRRFKIGAPDGISAVFLMPLLQVLKRAAPNIDISVRQLLPRQDEQNIEAAWRDALSDLEARSMDVAILPIGDVPARFMRQPLYEEDFVAATCVGHEFARDTSLKSYLAQDHLVVSHSGDPIGFVDSILAKRGHTRRIALTVPNFMFALSVLSETNLVSALPRNFVTAHGKRFGIVATKMPIDLPRFRLNLIAPNVAMKDTGLAWLVKAIRQASVNLPNSGKRKTSR